MIAGTKKCLNGRRAPGNERPRDELGAIDLRSEEPLAVRCVVVMRELAEGWINGSERVAENAMSRRATGARRLGPNTVSTCVVGDRDEITLGIVRAVDVCQRHCAREQAQDERDGNACPPH